MSKKPTKNKRAKKSAPPPLLFIDTNILLDFYRSQNDPGISLLTKIDSLHDHLISTCQVEMEFKKNRQTVIAAELRQMKSPEVTLGTPSFLSKAATVRVIKKRIADVRNRVRKLQDRVLSTLENPTTQDQVYRTAQRMFVRPAALVLQHDTKEYRAVWRRALKRFLEGRPPRKSNDTSAGDAINWEWIVECVKRTSRDVVIVSRDGDYGLTHNGHGYANNWLREELQSRVSKQRKVVLVDRLSTALKMMDVKVTREEIASENATISNVSYQKQEIENLVLQEVDRLMDEEQIVSMISTTNAFGWGCDVYGVKNLKLDKGRWIGDLEFSMSGEQHDEKPWHGQQIDGHCTVIIDADGTVSFVGIDAKLQE